METPQLFWTSILVFKHTHNKKGSLSGIFCVSACGHCLSTPPIRYLCTLKSSSLSLPFSWLSSFSSLSLCVSDRCCNALITIMALCWTCLPYVDVPFVMGIPELDRVLQVWLHQVEEKDHLPRPAGNVLLCCSPGGCWPLLQEHIAGLCSTWYPQGPQVLFLRARYQCFLHHYEWTLCNLLLII